jgi:DNA-binding transcriptional LysR family regulator
VESRWLQAFVAVAEELHFGRAAARLRMAQSPLSQVIRKLEKDIGTPLFDRNTRSVSLTASGRALLPHAYRVLEELDLARQAARAGNGTVYGTISIGFTGALNHQTLPPMTRAIRERYPEIDLTLVGRVMTRDGVEQVERGQLDLAFVGLPLAPSRLRTRLIGREPLGAVLPVHHDLAGEAQLDLRDLSAEGFITTPVAAGSALQDTAMRACVDAGFRARIVQEITDPFMILTLVAAGVGVALMTVGVAGILPSGAVLVPLKGEPTYMNHGLAWSAENRSPALRAVLEIAEEVLPTPVTT